MAEPAITRTPLHGTQTKFFGHINVSFLSMRYYFSQVQSTSSASCHAVLAFIIPVLLNFLQIKYQGKDTSPFDTHPISVRISIACLLLYCLAYDAKLRSSAAQHQQTYELIARHGMVVFGWLALVSLVSILLPDSLGPVLYFLYILFSASDFLGRRLLMLCNWLHQIVMVSRVPVMIPSRLTAHAFSNTASVTRDIGSA